MIYYHSLNIYTLLSQNNNIIIKTIQINNIIVLLSL